MHPLLLKPSIINALLPTFARNCFYAAIIGAFLWVLSFIPTGLGILRYNPVQGTIAFVIFIILFSLAPLSLRVLVLSCTTYSFEKTHVTKEFRFIIVKKQTVPYHQINRISVDISFWDRLCNAGDIALHTADEDKPDLVLHYIPEPQKIETLLYSYIKGTGH